MCAELEWEDGANENDECTVNEMIHSTTESDSLVCLMSFQASVCCKK